MSRPTHAQQQQEIDDALAAPPSQRLRWLFTPDPRWLKAVNTTALREVNAVRMFVATTLLFITTYTGVVAFALTRCGILIQMFGHKVFQVLPPPGKLSVKDWMVCEESTAASRLLNFAAGEFGTFGLILAAMASVALGSKWVNRSTDTEHQERVLLAKAEVEKAKKAPIIVPPTTNEHQAMPPVQSMTVNVGDEAVETTKNGELPATMERPAMPAKPKAAPDLYADDERGD